MADRNTSSSAAAVHFVGADQGRGDDGSTHLLPPADQDQNYYTDTGQALGQQEGASWIESASAEQSYPVISGDDTGGMSMEDLGLIQESIYDDLPVFADDRSKVVNEAIKKLEKDLEKAGTAATENEERLRIMQEHLVNVVQEVQHTNMLLDAKKKELGTEEHLKQLVSEISVAVRKREPTFSRRNKI